MGEHTNQPDPVLQPSLPSDDGSPSGDIDRAKAALRERMWSHLITAGVAPPDARGSIPTFNGHRATAVRLTELECWQQAQVVKANPDQAQLPIRIKALQCGKLLYMAVPRMATTKPFYRLDPTTLDLPPEIAATNKGAAEIGEYAAPQDMNPVDLVICGSVAVNRHGARIGKGAGYSDLELALLAEAGIVTEHTIVVAPVHELQVTEDDIPEAQHDFPVDYIITPQQIIQCPKRTRPKGIIRQELTEEIIRRIPVLRT
jgi:5-formyltetrahydrofolate cyclo-ligase